MLQFTDASGDVTFNDHGNSNTIGTFTSTNQPAMGSVHNTLSTQAMVIGDRGVAANTFAITWQAIKGINIAIDSLSGIAGQVQ